MFTRQFLHVLVALTVIGFSESHFSGVANAVLTTRTETFDSLATTSFVTGGTEAPGNDLGFSDTNHITVGSGAGEAGGDFIRSRGFDYYADVNLGGELSRTTESFTMSGNFKITDFNEPSTNVWLGFFHTEDTPIPGDDDTLPGMGRFVGFNFAEPAVNVTGDPDGYRSRAIIRRDSGFTATGGAGATGGFERVSNLALIYPNIDYTVELTYEYDPMGDPDTLTPRAVLSGEVRLAGTDPGTGVALSVFTTPELESNTPNSFLETFNAFGIAAGGAGGTPAEEWQDLRITTFFDDLTYSVFSDVPPTLPGDYNGDSVVDLADYLDWKSTFGDTVAPGSGADGNSNGIVDAADYTVWRDNLGAANGVAVTAVVPEPASLGLALLLFGLATVAFRARRAA